VSVTSVNFQPIRAAVDQCCKTEEECGSCEKGKCLIGFAQMAIDYAVQKRTYRIPKGNQLVPQNDTRVYYQNNLAHALAEILCQCQSCQDSHDEECVINVTRLALELALLGDNLLFTGSALQYLMAVSRTHPEHGNQMLELYKHKRNLA